MILLKNKFEEKPKKRIIIGIILVLLLTGLFLFLANGPFLENYYKNRKVAAMFDAYNQINKASATGAFDSEDFDLALQSISEKNNVSVIIVDTDTEMVKGRGTDVDKLQGDLLRYIFKLSQNLEDEILLTKDKFEIHQIREPQGRLEYLDLFGILDNTKFILVRSPIEGIRESSRAASVLLNYFIIIIAVVLITAIFVEDRRRTIITLKEKNRRLEEDIRQKEELERMRSEFLSNVSHELKTPLALIRGYAEGLQEGVSEDEESRQYYCDVIVDEVAKMNGMVKKLMDINQLEFGEVQFTPETFNLTQVILSYLNSAKILYEDKNIQLLYDSSEEIYVYADEYYVEEIFGNYFSNALNHVSGNKKIEICTKISDNKVVVSVFNTGKPIPEDSLPHLFEKFYKVDKARTREYGGSGVGLSIVKAILDSMNENYGVENYNDGVRFFFTLPVGEKELINK